jgi:hypothetical protein
MRAPIELIVDFVRRWSEKTEIGAGRFIVWLDITPGKFYDWRERYGKVNEHNGWVPRDFWLEDREKQAIVGFQLRNPRRYRFRFVSRHCTGILTGAPEIQAALNCTEAVPGARPAGTTKSTRYVSTRPGHPIAFTTSAS